MRSRCPGGQAGPLRAARQPRLVRRARQLPARLLRDQGTDRRLPHAPAPQLLRDQARPRLVDLGHRHPAGHLHRRRAARVLPQPGGRGGRQGRPADGEAELGQGGPRRRCARVLALPLVLRGAGRPCQGPQARHDAHGRHAPLRALRARRCRRRADPGHRRRRRRVPLLHAHAQEVARRASGRPDGGREVRPGGADLPQRRGLQEAAAAGSSSSRSSTRPSPRCSGSSTSCSGPRCSARSTPARARLSRRRRGTTTRGCSRAP